VTDETCEEMEARLVSLERLVEELREAVTAVTNRDVPLLKGTVRTIVGAAKPD
jgi:hypothetical protein